MKDTEKLPLAARVPHAHRPFVYIVAVALCFVITTASAFGADKHLAPAEPPDTSSEALRTIISTRGTAHWTLDEILLTPTLPPNVSVRTIPEWEPVGGVMFALDQDELISFKLNEEFGTADHPKKLFARDPAILDDINDYYCGGNEDNSDDDNVPASDSSKADNPARNRQKIQCDGEELKPVFLEKHLDDLSLAPDLLSVANKICAVSPVIFLLNSTGLNEVRFDEIRDYMSTYPSGVKLLACPQFSMVQVPFDSKWVRDYGPFFARTASGDLITIDTRYPEDTAKGEDSDLAQILKRALAADGKDAAKDDDDSEAAARQMDDLFPSRLSVVLRQEDKLILSPHPVSVVRPPIILSGGDFATDGAGTAFTSTNTLELNGGNVEMMDLSFEKYFGIQHVVYLHPLPGSTVKHIDMFFQVIAPNVMLLGKFYRQPDSPVEAALQNQASRALEDNLNILASYYAREGRKFAIIDGELPSKFDPKMIYVVRIPMPPVSRPLASEMEKYIKNYYQSSHEAGLHEKRLVTANLFNNGLKRTVALQDSIVHLMIQEGDEPSSDQHGRELLNEVNKRTSDLVSLATRYAALSQEYQKDSTRLQQAQSQVLSAINHVQADAGRANASLPASALEELGIALHSFLRACDEFSDSIQKGEKKDATLYELAEANKEASEQHLAAIQDDYPYGTDLYRTFLNLLQVRNSSAMTVVIPHFRSPGVEQDEASAVDKIRKTFAVLYPNVTVIPAPSDGFIKQLGSIHCITKTLPDGITVLDNQWNRAEAKP